MEILTKSISKGAVTDVDTTKRIVVGYFAKFNDTPDSDGDIIDPKAFDNTLAMNGPNAGNRIWHLWNHSFNHPINKPYYLGVDSTGLKFESKFPNTTEGNDKIVLYQEKAITEHSFGFNTVNEIPIQNNSGQDYNKLMELRLWEGSSVLWGADWRTNVVGLKSEEMEFKSKLLDNLLHNGNLSDEMFMQIEQLLKDIKEMFRPATPPEPKQTASDVLQAYYNKLSHKLN